MWHQISWWPPSPAAIPAPFPPFPIPEHLCPSPGASPACSSPAAPSCPCPGWAHSSRLPQSALPEMRCAQAGNVPRSQTEWETDGQRFANRNSFLPLFASLVLFIPENPNVKHKQGKTTASDSRAAELWQIYFWWDVLSKTSTLTLGPSPAGPGNYFLAGNTTRMLWVVKLNTCVHF